jgi:hypothetical protein
MKPSIRLRAAVILACFFVLVVAVVKWLDRSAPYGNPGLPSPSTNRDVERLAELPAARGSAGFAEPASTSDIDRQPVAPKAAGEAGRPQPERTLIIQDVDGRELHHESGEFFLSSREDTPESEKTLVPFTEGRFSLKGFPEGAARIERARTFSAEGDRPVAFDEEWFQFKLDEPTLLTGHYLPDCTLLVVDARTGMSLNDVSVLPAIHAGSEQSHPGPYGPSSFVLRDRASPVRLPPTRGLQSYWVTARGYNWSFIVVDHETGGERVVQVDPAGKLVVEVHGDIDSYLSQSLQVDIRVYSHATHSMVTSSELGPRGWQGFEGVSAGRYDVKVEVGPVGASPIVLGETRVNVAANATTTARIELTNKDVFPPRVEVRGEIVLLNKHRTLGLFPSLRIQPAAGPALRDGDAVRFVTPHGPALRYRDVVDIKRSAMEGRYDKKDGSEECRWKAELTSGRYLFVVEPVQHEVLLDVPESPAAPIRIVLPELFPITLRVVDAKTLKPIRGATIRWSRLSAEKGSDGWIEMDLESGAESATVYLTEGPFSFAASGPGYRERSMDGQVASSSSKFTLELHHCISREVILMEGKTVIPWSQWMTCNIERLDSEGTYPGENLGDSKMHACFEQSGVYRLVFDGLEGLRELTPVVVDVSEGDFTPIVVQLGR